MVAFIALGILGGAAGALFIKASRFWAQNFRHIPAIKRWPLFEVVVVALITGLISFWNSFTRLAVAELLFALTSPCDGGRAVETGLCPSSIADIPGILKELSIAFLIKGFLTIITFGIVWHRHHLNAWECADML